MVDGFSLLYSAVLRLLHSVWHVSLTLQSVPAEFDLSTDYLESL